MAASPLPLFLRIRREDLAAFAKEGITDTLLQTTWEEHNPLRTFPALKVSILNNTVYIAGRAERVFQSVEPWRAMLLPRPRTKIRVSLGQPFPVARTLRLAGRRGPFMWFRWGGPT